MLKIIENVGEEGFWKILEETPPDSPGRQIHYGIGENGHVIADRIQEIKVIYWLMNQADPGLVDEQKLWSDFENYLAKLDYEAIMKTWGYCKDNASCLWETIEDIPRFFFEWINSIKLNSESNSPYNQLMNIDTDYAITFNYTETLEKVYGFCENNILYMHGKREIEGELIERKKMTAYGMHNCKLEIGFDRKQIKEKRFDNLEESVKNLLMITENSLIKRTDEIIREKEYFFERLENSNVSSIYSIGFSYSEVDMLYIEKICNTINKIENSMAITWFLCDFDDKEKRDCFEEKIYTSGFKGTVKSFHVND